VTQYHCHSLISINWLSANCGVAAVWLGAHTQEGGSTPDGSASGSSSDEDAPPPTAQPPQQQQRQAAAAAEAERQRKRQDALRRIEASTARLRKRGTGSAMVDAVLQQMYERVSTVPMWSAVRMQDSSIGCAVQHNY
jgi:hypothetical protein